MTTKLINGFAFVRDSPVETEAMELKGFKRVIIAAVVWVPERMESDEYSYIINVQPPYFDEVPISLEFTNPQPVPDMDGLRIDQILTMTNWHPVKPEEDPDG